LILGKPQQPSASLALGFIVKEMFLLLGFKLVVLVLGLPLLLIPVLGFPLFLFLMGLLTAVDFLDLLLSRKGFGFAEKLSYLKHYFLPFALFSLPVVSMAWIPLLQLLILPGAAAGGVLFYLHHPKPMTARLEQEATGVPD
jgi:CysZ protein